MRITAGSLKGKKLQSISAEGYRPAMARVREAIFSMLNARGYYCEEKRILDIFAGTGSLAFEAMSRGAKHCTLVEINKKASAMLYTNAKNLSLLPTQYSINNTTAEQFLLRCKESYDIVFIDPPYYQNYLQKTLHLLIKKNILHEGSIVVTETEPKLSFTPQELCPELDCIVDSCYGQTRVNFWVPHLNI